MSRYKLTKDKFLTDEEQDALLIKIAEQRNERDSLFIFALMFTGARVQEILNMVCTDIPGDGNIYIRGIKGSDDRHIPIPAWLETRFRRFFYIQDTDTPAIFNISYSRAVQIWQKVAPNRKSLKSLRHTFAVQIYRQTRDIYLVKRALGHRCITNTMVYVDYILMTEELTQLKQINLYGLPKD